MALVGVQPVLTQVPPTRWRSTTATVIPAPAKRNAKDGPAWPVPMMIASKSGMNSLSCTARIGWVIAPRHYDIFGQIGSDLCRSPPGSRLTSLLDPISSPNPTETATAPDE